MTTISSSSCPAAPGITACQRGASLATFGAVSPDDNVHDVPSPIDLRDPAEAERWAAAADVKRPWRCTFRSAIADLLRNGLHPPLRVLELGPGPGLLAEAIIGLCQVESYTLLDFSSPMLEMCRQRLGEGPAFRYIVGDYTREDWADALIPPFDAVVAMQSVHEIRHKRHAPRLYARIRELLRGEGLLAVCDHAPLDDSARFRALYSTVAEQHAALASAGLVNITTHLSMHGLYLLSAMRPTASASEPAVAAP